jgi:hypothetical protein
MMSNRWLIHDSTGNCIGEKLALHAKTAFFLYISAVSSKDFPNPTAINVVSSEGDTCKVSYNGKEYLLRKGTD